VNGVSTWGFIIGATIGAALFWGTGFLIAYALRSFNQSARGYIKWFLIMTFSWPFQLFLIPYAFTLLGRLLKYVFP
jgi:ABC-type glycerol-3-phosphate transport system permease component